MNKDNFKVSLDALSTLKKIKDIQGDFSELINEEIIDVKNGKIVATLIFEKYYLRSSNWAALIVTVDNIEEIGNLTSFKDCIDVNAKYKFGDLFAK